MERVEQFFFAYNIDENRQVPTLLSLIGSNTYTLLRDLLSPDKPATKSFQGIVTTLQQHLSPKPLEIEERFRFYKRNLREGETVLAYVAELKKLATQCNFGANLYADTKAFAFRSKTEIFQGFGDSRSDRNCRSWCFGIAQWAARRTSSWQDLR